MSGRSRVDLEPAGAGSDRASQFRLTQAGAPQGARVVFSITGDLVSAPLTVGTGSAGVEARVRAFADPKRPAVGSASFMVEDYVAHLKHHLAQIDQLLSD